MVQQAERRKLHLFTLGLLVALFGLNAGVLSPIPRAAAQNQMKKDQPKVEVFKILIVNQYTADDGRDKAYTFAGVIIDRSRRVKRDFTTAEVKVTNDMPSGKNPGQPYDVIFLIRPPYVKDGEILTFTSDPINDCRPYLKTFLTKTLSSKRIAKAYQGAKLTPADYLTGDLEGNGWLASCGEQR
ncbi:MAG TPA: hypothetical protein VE131_06915 [Terriglobales bacterium]|nr:hypothetical protein [Terriglobales bacterium]